MISKKEQVWRYILEEALGKSRLLDFEQQKIAQILGISTSTVFNALKIPRQSGAVKVGGRKFSLVDISKLLTIWATQRTITRDIIYHTHIDKPAKEIESSMPSDVIYGGYSAYRLRFGDLPADYEKIYVYAAGDTLQDIRARFPAQKKDESNVFVFEADAQLALFGDIVPNSQLYADLWNLPDWYAHDFLEALKQQLNL